MALVLEEFLNSLYRLEINDLCQCRGTFPEPMEQHWAEECQFIELYGWFLPIPWVVLGGLPFTMDKAQISLPYKTSVQVSVVSAIGTYLLQRELRPAGTITMLLLAANEILCISTGASQTVALAVEIRLVTPTKQSLSHYKVSGRSWLTLVGLGSSPRKNMTGWTGTVLWQCCS